MMKPIFVVVTCLVLTGCYSYNFHDTIVHCKPKPAFQNAFPEFKYYQKDSETSVVIDVLLGPQEVTFRDMISGEMMTVGLELSRYYICIKVEPTEENLRELNNKRK